MRGHAGSASPTLASDTAGGDATSSTIRPLCTLQIIQTHHLQSTLPRSTTNASLCGPAESSPPPGTDAHEVLPEEREGDVTAAVGIIEVVDVGMMVVTVAEVHNLAQHVRLESLRAYAVSSD